jgi:tRNA threonylcarbamoyl adenosine modification protein (Sua5/YciO/YrdC/YwlC family)
MIIKLYKENINEKHLQQVVDVLKNGGIAIFPTDTVYGLGCDISDQKAVEKVARIKGLKLEKANFSFICHDLSHLSDFCKQIDNHVFRLMKKNLPGPFTFILPANNNVPKIFRSKKKTIGIRVPDNPITLEIVRRLNNPLLTTSIHDADEVIEYTTDPELIHEKYKDIVDLVVDGGYGSNVPSTIVDCSNNLPEIIRDGERELVE